MKVRFIDENKLVMRSPGFEFPLYLDKRSSPGLRASLVSHDTWKASVLTKLYDDRTYLGSQTLAIYFYVTAFFHPMN
jgi:hypothetical protein